MYQTNFRISNHQISGLWIGFKGKKFNRKPMVFTIKYRSVRCHLSHHPILRLGVLNSSGPDELRPTNMVECITKNRNGLRNQVSDQTNGNPTCERVNVWTFRRNNQFTATPLFAPAPFPSVGRVLFHGSSHMGS